jgi:hypothetical protein
MQHAFSVSEHQLEAADLALWVSDEPEMFMDAGSAVRAFKLCWGPQSSLWSSGRVFSCSVQLIDRGITMLATWVPQKTNYFRQVRVKNG